MEDHQAELLARIVRHAYDTSPFYRERLKPLIARRGAVDLSRWNEVPPLLREDLQTRVPEILSRAIPEEHGRPYRISTSGTSGKPVTVTATALTGKVRRAINWRTHTWHNVDWSKQFGTAIRRKVGTGDWPGGGRYSIPWGPSWLSPDSPRGVFIGGHTPFDKLAEWIARKGVRYFSGLPITLAALAEESARPNLSLDMCISYGMQLKPEHRTAVKNAFGAEIVELYGSEDCGPIAHACEKSSLHVLSELVRVEIVDDDGKPCPPGTVGRVLVTVFHNAAQPIIRYALGDVASFGAPCSCGRSHPVISGIPGRLRDLFRRPDGSRFVAHTLIGLFPPDAGVKWWQIAQIAPDAFEVRTVAATPFSAEDCQHVISIMHKAWKWNCRVKFRHFDSIPHGPGVKHRDYVNECQNDGGESSVHRENVRRAPRLTRIIASDYRPAIVTQPTDIRTLYEHFLRTQSFNAQELESYQAQLLAGIVRHAYETSPFYHERLKLLILRRGAVDLARWNEVPVLTREELKMRGPELMSRAVPPDHGKPYWVSTSGTSGKPVTVVATALTGKVRKAINWRTHVWHSIDWSKQYGIAMRRKPGVALWPEGARSSSPWGPPWLSPESPPRIILAAHTPIDKIAEWVGRNQIRYLAALPITLAALAEEPERPQLSVEKFLSFGMRVKPEHRTAVKNGFGAEIAEFYGSEDCGPMAHPCENGSLHALSEVVHLEIVDDDGNPCPPGQVGRVLVTVLHNAAQPIIRYAIGDVASFGAPCSCGRPHPVINGIPGRLRDLFCPPDGSRFVAQTLDGLFPPHAGVKWWQIAQTETNALEVRTVATVPLNTADREHVTATLHEAWNWNCRVDFRQLEGAPYGPGVKHIDFVNEWENP